MAKHAGCAKSQGIGLLKDWKSWSPFEGERTKWLLLGGALEPPCDITISRRRPTEAEQDRSGSYLHGITQDLANMSQTVNQHNLGNIWV